MHWTDTRKTLPKNHNRIVLVYHEGGYYVARYDKFKKGFSLQNGNFLSCEGDTHLHWTELSPP
ncbi:MAG TPA: hypothetical protein PLQ93_08510 [Bacteroidia bacterium]|nr:hypothetical protein [Bacteroidia bacterium]